MFSSVVPIEVFQIELGYSPRGGLFRTQIVRLICEFRFGDFIKLYVSIGRNVSA